MPPVQLRFTRDNAVEKRFIYIAQLVAVFVLLAGCFMVLKPFLAASLLAVVVCVSTWPLYLWLLKKLKGWKNLAAFVMTLSLVLVVILPLALVAYSMADNMTASYDRISQFIDAGIPAPPAWLKGLPVIGESIASYWHLVTTNHAELLALEKRLLEPARDFMLAVGILLGQGVIQMSLSVFVSFFLYRDGVTLLRFLKMAMGRVIGTHAVKVLDIIDNTIQGVMHGLLGTALAQGLVAIAGFVIAGVPTALLLGLATALLSVTPIGPPVIWIGAVIWFIYQGSMGWAIFMALWGFFLISGVDNVLKPLIISRNSNLPFILIFFGVLGGVFAFGFVGIFIGPTLLAIGFSLTQEWAA